MRFPKLNYFYLPIYYLSTKRYETANHLSGKEFDKRVNYKQPGVLFTFFFLTIFLLYLSVRVGSPIGSAVKNPPYDAGDTGSIPGPVRSPGERNGNPLQDPCLEIPR